MPIGFDDLVNDVMTDWPATVRVFLDFKMGCVGCPIACFHTLDNACGETSRRPRCLPEGAA
jgi:hybrid cluster-associated redox disulfide protein